MEKDIFGFRIDFEVDSGKSFLVLTENGLSRRDIVGFQVEMIAKNRIPGVAGLNIRERDLEVRFYYDISGLISLSNFFKRQKVTKADFVKILQNIMGTFTGCKNFLLNEKCFIISENLIFINPDSLEVFLIYIPCSRNAEIVDLFKAFIVNLVVNTANIETNDNFVQKLLGLIKEEHLCISELNTAIRKVEGTSPPNKIIQKNPENGWQESNSAITPESLQAQEDHPLANHKKVVNFVPAILVLLAILAAAGIKINQILVKVDTASMVVEYFQSIGTAVAAILLLAGTIIYWRFRKKGSSPDEIYPTPVQINISQRETAVTTEDSVENKTIPVNIDETVVLSSKQQPVLVGIGEEDSIVISKPDFVVGRNLDTCDYAIHNKSIGRAHARIQSTDGKFYIFDLDSKNGTFINGNRLISNKRYELKPNDKISFANIQFCFKLEYII